MSHANEAMTPQEAARALVEASRYEDALAERTAGVTWMVWGIVTPAIFLSYSFFGALDLEGWWLSLVWIPWVAMGVLTTVSLWRSAALAAPALAEEPSGGFWLRFLGFSALITLLMWFLQPSGPEMPLIIVGALWSGMGILNLWNASRFSRIVCVVAGLPLVLTGVALALLQAPIELASIVALCVSGAAPFLAGLYQTLRG